MAHTQTAAEQQQQITNKQITKIYYVLTVDRLPIPTFICNVKHQQHFVCVFIWEGQIEATTHGTVTKG